MDSDQLRARLESIALPALRWYDQTGSTNLDALQWASEGAPDGALVAADRQAAGRGRMGRSWVTHAGVALAFSLILRPSALELSHTSLFSPLGALGVAQALEGLGLRPQIKWPNDVLLNRSKTCGILAETAWTGQTLDALVLGVGVNVAPSSVPPATELLFPATCVEAGLGRGVDRFSLMAAILREIFAMRPFLGKEEFFQAWESRLAFRGEAVVVHRPGKETLAGELLGIDANGGLRIRSAGREINILAGDVHLRPQP